MSWALAAWAETPGPLAGLGEDLILLFRWRPGPATREQGFKNIQLISRVGKGLGHFLFKPNFQSLQFISQDVSILFMVREEGSVLSGPVFSPHLSN